MATGPQLFYCLWQDSRIRETLFELLPKKDICNVRLASSACCNLATKRLFLRTHLTFTASSFTRQHKVQALSRIGHYIEHLTFSFPHSDATFLPPLIHPESGREISFLYTPHTSMGSVLERPKFANSGLGEILTSQYPPLFHAATNVPSFINALKYLVNIRHLTIKTPGQSPAERYRRDTVDYALISLRVALERAPVKKLTKLTLSSVHPAAFLYLRPVQGFGCTPSAGRRWRQIRKMHISVDSWDFYGPSPGLDHLKIMQDYLNLFSPDLEKLTFTWHGRKGPCPIALAADPLFAPPRSSQKLFHEVTSPMSPLPPAPACKPVLFRKLRHLAVRNTTMNVAQVAGLVASHKHCVREFDFENSVLIGDGSWDDALAPLMNNKSQSGYWTRHSTATVTEPIGTDVHPVHRAPVDLTEPGHSPAVAAVTQKLLDVALQDGDDDEPERESVGEYEEVDIELASDVEAARHASTAYANQSKKRKVTKRRRRRKPGHERREDTSEEVQPSQARRHLRQKSSDSIGQPQEPAVAISSHRLSHERRRSNQSLSHTLLPPLSIPHQPSHDRLFGEVASVYSTVSSRRLFGEITPSLSRSGSKSGSGSEPELTHSPTDDADSGLDDSRPQTPTTPKMAISAPILDTSPNMPTLLQPTVYDPTAELCSEISAVQRDLGAEEKYRRMAEDVEAQTSALRRAKELVLSRLGKEFGATGNTKSPRKESFGASAFLASTRFREGLFGRGSGYAVNAAAAPVAMWLALYLTYGLLDAAWLYTRPSGLSRYLSPSDDNAHRAWALVTGSSSGIGKCLALELAERGFNVVLHGRNLSKLEGVQGELQKACPEIETRVLVADAAQCHRVDFEGHLKDQLRGLNLTVLINCAGAGPSPSFGALEDYTTGEILDNVHLNAAFPAMLTATVLPIMKEWDQGSGSKSGSRSANRQERQGGETTQLQSTRRAERNEHKRSVLIINIGSVTDQGFPMVSFYSAGKAATHALHKALSLEAALSALNNDQGVGGGKTEVEVISHRVGHTTGVSHSSAPASLFQPHARTIAKAVLARTGCGRKSVIPYWPHALQQGFLACVPVWAKDRVIVLAMREQRRAQDEAAKKGK
ncbi:hypothetical protein F5Y17DRAFT_466388 [Xylariaceae sp. FL0594]|nr:hypothetical protein F5Y17DRAFT_466388 [Xylariaceae sp. FL0594]